MQDDKYKKILEKDYQDLLTDVVLGIVINDDQPKALELVKLLERALEVNSAALKADIQLAAFYQNIVLKLKFIALPSLDDKNIISLFKSNFCYQLNWDGYELNRKLNIKMLSILVMEDRNKFKEELKKALLENNEQITSKSVIKTVKDWLKDYMVKVGLESQDKLARAQYMMELKNAKDMTEVEHEYLKFLFNFFDNLGLPSDEPRGFEEEYPIMMDGKLNIFRKGILESVSSSKLVEEALKHYVPQDNIQPNNDVLSDIKPAQNAEAVSSPVVTAVFSLSQTTPRIAELEGILGSYSSSSLEYKAISQEILRLQKAEARKDAKR